MNCTQDLDIVFNESSYLVTSACAGMSYCLPAEGTCLELLMIVYVWPVPSPALRRFAQNIITIWFVYHVLFTVYLRPYVHADDQRSFVTALSLRSLMSLSNFPLLYLYLPNSQYSGGRVGAKTDTLETLVRLKYTSYVASQHFLYKFPGPTNAWHPFWFDLCSYVLTDVQSTKS